MSDLSLIETLRWEPESGFLRLPLHLARLTASAGVLGLPGAERAGAALLAAVGGDKPLRVRLELFPEGHIAVTTAPFSPLSPGTVWRVAVAALRLSSTDALLRHKTSRREIYEAARAEFSRDMADEVILLNERDELCEGTITSLFVEDDTGKLRTPPLSCGLLAGVLRTDLLCRSKARVGKLRLADIEGRPFHLGNSLRGLIPATLVSATLVSADANPR
ncbi:aminotransferase class IV family protein [Rhizobium sp. TRM95111]|uniref:aminotransferase class IV family protein n=1 Tax=Rhizobium alarense TaxID=2846851 RepID=UPI001F32C7EE|nr:aminotransferase class IV family protein [Rhizobium alarense]MCF3638458.1 aminotransferase class IV family protein [Rhizobium alarense]